MEGLEWDLAERAYIVALNQEKHVVARKEETSARLKELADGNPCRGKMITLTQVKREGSIDYKSVPELKGIDLEPYRKKETTYWKINVKKDKEDEQV